MEFNRISSQLESLNSRLSSDPETPLMLAGVCFVTGYLIGSGRSETLRRTGSSLVSHLGSFLYSSATESLKKKRESLKAA